MGILKAVQLTTPLKHGLTAVVFITDWVTGCCEEGCCWSREGDMWNLKEYSKFAG